MTEEQFLRAIEADPLDEGIRLIYSDWLMERDRVFDAERQRQWVKAFRFLADFTRSAYDSYDYDDDGERVPGTQKLNYAEVMGEIEWWKGTVTGKDTRYGRGGSIGFGTTSAQSELNDPEKRREFWRCFKVITGVEAPEDLRNQEWYSCAC